MSRRPRLAPDGYAHHVINRGNRRQTIFLQPSDCEAFLDVMADAAERVPMRVLAFALMRNHFHLVLWPHEGVSLSAYMKRLTNAHVHHHQAVHDIKGSGHVYQGRFKNFVIQEDAHLLTVLRYVEANPVRAGCVASADEWRWSSIGRSSTSDNRELLTRAPVARPANWLEIVNAEMPSEDLVALRTCVKRSRPYGDPHWVNHFVARYDLQYTVRDPHRPPRELSGLAVSA